jgi:hypothetical protein
MAVALYTRGDRARGLKLGEAALRIDIRYGDLEFLKQNLWGDRLLADTKKLLDNPQIQATIQERQEQQQQQESSPIQITPQ